MSSEEILNIEIEGFELNKKVVGIILRNDTDREYVERWMKVLFIKTRNTLRSKNNIVRFIGTNAIFRKKFSRGE